MQDRQRHRGKSLHLHGRIWERQGQSAKEPGENPAKKSKDNDLSGNLPAVLKVAVSIGLPDNGHSRHAHSLSQGRDHIYNGSAVGDGAGRLGSYEIVKKKTIDDRYGGLDQTHHKGGNRKE